jgi:hypothetical protein
MNTFGSYLPIRVIVLLNLSKGDRIKKINIKKPNQPSLPQLCLQSKKTRVNWKVTLTETITIFIIATIVSLLLGTISLSYMMVLNHQAHIRNCL